MADNARLDGVPVDVALRRAITSTTPPPETIEIDLMDDGSARVAYAAPSHDPTDPANQAAIEALTGGFAAVVKHHPDPPSRLQAVGTSPDGPDEPLLQWHAERAWAEGLVAGELSPRRVLERIADTSDMIAINNSEGADS
jgi:hypothetical protein